jgi:O-antigen/teichoic acid export membrane protein
LAETVFGRLLRLGRDARSQFVVVNVVANLLVLGRSLFALAFLDDADLGRVTIVQTIVIVAGFAQFGLFNGAYRILCDNRADEASALNRLAWAFLMVLVAVGVGAALLLSGWLGLGIGLLLAGAASGLLTLARTWVSNQLIAIGDLVRLNLLTAVSAIGSLLPLAAVRHDALAAVLASIAIQPLLFAAGALLLRPDLRPGRGTLSWPLARRALSAGFALFLVSLLLQAVLVAERGYVAAAHGLDGLGRLFLPYLYITLFQLVPGSLDAIFLRRIVAAHSAGDDTGTREACGRFLILNIGYCLLAVLLTLFVAPGLLDLLYPARSADLGFVFLVLPGLVAFTLANALAIQFNVRIRYGALYAGYGAGAALAVCVLALAQSGRFGLDLDGVMSLRSAAYVLTAAIIAAASIAGWRTSPGFRPLLAR